MERALKLIISLYVWVALVQLYIGTRFSSAALVQHVGMKIANDDYISGFISIDCGAQMNYVDEQTGILYKTDKDFIETGTNQVVSTTAINLDYIGRQLKTLRSFPKGERNCYNLKPKQGKNNKYLIRAMFNYEQNPPFDFHLYLGANHWRRIDSSYNWYLSWEIVHVAPVDSINVCLVNIGRGIPFISALELRPLSSSVYPILPTSQALLNYVTRIDVGSAFPFPVPGRYKSDIYDRLWLGYITDDWYMKSINISDGETLENAYKVPVQVWRTAATSFNLSYALEFDFESTFWTLDKHFKYYVFFHFAEIEQLPPGHKRIINITLNNESILSEPLILDYLKPVTIMNKNATQGKVHFRISATSESDAPPILNAFEVYKLITDVSSTDTRDFEAIMDIKNTYKISRPNWQGDPCLPDEYVWEGLDCNSYDGNPRITSLSLRSSQLTKKIATSFSYLTELEFLDLSNNDLVGPLPEFLAQFPKLKVLNLTGNKLSGPIPKALKKKGDTTLQLSLANNPGLCMSDSCEKQKFVIPLVASMSALIAILAISIGIWIFKWRKQGSSFQSQNGSLRPKNQVFSYLEILNITNNFRITLGEGGFGKVYLGTLQDDTQVAVKLLSPSSRQGYKEFQSEAQLLKIVHHRNLVSLVGYCDEGDFKALIYEYMDNGDLRHKLSEKDSNVLKWNIRLQIAVDAAKGLDYLHNGCKPPIIHRDLKSSNILLNSDMQAKISDFGLSKAFLNDNDSHLFTRPAGTPGYIDPQFQRSGILNKQSDIYSFGMILLELITSFPPVRKASNQDIIFILDWIHPKIESGDIEDIIDSRLQGEFCTNSVWKAVEIAMSCIAPILAQRPDISSVLQDLKECLALEMDDMRTKNHRSGSCNSLDFTPPSAR